MSINPMPAPAMPLQLHCSYQDITPLLRLCTAQFAQGAQAYSLTVSPEEMERIAAELKECARRAKTDIVRSASMPNGKPPGV